MRRQHRHSRPRGGCCVPVPHPGGRTRLPGRRRDPAVPGRGCTYRSLPVRRVQPGAAPPGASVPSRRAPSVPVFLSRGGRWVRWGCVAPGPWAPPSSPADSDRPFPGGWVINHGAVGAASPHAPLAPRPPPRPAPAPCGSRRRSPRSRCFS